MWIEQRARQYRVYWRTKNDNRAYEAFATREEAQKFKAAAVIVGSPEDALVILKGMASSCAPVSQADIAAPAEAQSAPAPTPALLPGALSPGAPLIMQELFDLCMGQSSGVQTRTLTDAASAFANHVVPYFGVTDVRLLRNKVRPRRAAPTGPDGKPMSITAWVNWLSTRSALDRAGAPTGQPLSPKTIRNLHALVSQVCQFAVDDDEDEPLLPRNPCIGTKLPEVQQQERPFLEPSHFKALHAAIDPWFRPLLVFLVATGVRWGEAAGLRVRHMHLDPSQGRPYVEIMIAWRRGSDRRMVLGRVKTKASQRRITLAPSAVAALRPLLVGKGPDDAVFTMRGKGPLHHGNFTARFLMPAVAACAPDGVDQRLRAHGFRHTHAAWLLSAGRPVTSVQKRLGHESPLTTMKIYGHHTADVDAGDLDVVDGVLVDVVAVDLDDEGVSAAIRPELFRPHPADELLPLLDDSDDDDLIEEAA